MSVNSTIKQRNEIAMIARITLGIKS